MPTPNIEDLLKQNRPRATMFARQLLFMQTPMSKLVETYLYNNEGFAQKLDGFPSMRQIYDYPPKKMILKCSRKTLKSTLISNILVLNCLRYNFYKMLYVSPLEATTKLFSNNYLAVRFQSPPIRKVITGWLKEDVFEKTIADTNSGILLKYASDDASRIRGPAVDSCCLDEIQDILIDILPVIRETMTMSPFKREIFAGTPLTTTNTINILWKQSNRMEWLMKCQGCNHWNGLIEENEPLKMIREPGLSCSKCSRVLNSREGQWVAYSPKNKDFIGYHLAQPILPHFNENQAEWMDVYNKVHGGQYNITKVHNEVFGLAYDVGAKPITEEELRNKCTLGPMIRISPGKTNLDIFERNKHKYRIYTCGVDWGVSMVTSRTSCCIGALRDDLVYEVFFAKIMKDFDYERNIHDIAELANGVQAFCASDSGPDPIRGIKLMKLTSPLRTQLIRYEHSKFIQRMDMPKDAIDPTQTRWCLHRSDTINLTMRMVKEGRILFPQWEDSQECLQDILNVDIEVKDGLYRQEMFYRHAADQPDDFLHALNFAFCQALMVIGDPLLQGPSSSAPSLPDS